MKHERYPFDNAIKGKLKQCIKRNNSNSEIFLFSLEIINCNIDIQISVKA